MSHNKNRYTDYTKPAAKYTAEVETGIEVEAVELETVVEETVEQIEEPIAKIGRVVNCEVLNVRKEPSINASVICTVNESSEVEIDEDASTDEFYKVALVNGVTGYCMKNFVEV